MPSNKPRTITFAPAAANLPMPTQQPAGEDSRSSRPQLAPQRLQRRSLARLAAVQHLFAHCFEKKSHSLSLQELVAGQNLVWINEEEQLSYDPAFGKKLLIHAIKLRPLLAEGITQLRAQSNSKRELELLLQMILTIFLTEVSLRPQQPVATLIAEYLRLAEAFYGKREIKLLHALIDQCLQKFATLLTSRPQ